MLGDRKWAEEATLSDSTTNQEERAPEVDDYTATTIPVHIEIDVKQTVLDLSEAEQILRDSTSIALGPCVCRSSEKNCDAPVDTCLSLNSASERTVENEEGFRYVDVDKAIEVLRESHRTGLVHLAFRKPDAEITEFCSCCSCCCWFLKKLKQFDYHSAVIESSHIAQHLPERCVASGTCVEKCPFDAWLPAENGGKPTLDPERCFGCGICVTACPANAIAFLPRDP